MLLEIILWLLLYTVVGIGGVAQAVAASARGVQSSLQVKWTTRVVMMEFWGGALTAGATASVAAIAVLLAMNFTGDVSSIAACVGLSVLLTRLIHAAAREYARANLERLAEPLLGNAVVFLPLVEPPNEPAEPAQMREDTLAQIVDAGEKVGLIESGEREMITSILQLDKTLTREIMVPRIDVVALDVETSFAGALDVMTTGAHSRIPVYEESIDHIIGLVYAKDLLRILRDRSRIIDHAKESPNGARIDESEAPNEDTVTLRSLLRPPFFVPESKPIDELLEELQRTQVHMGIAVDEYGGTAGIVTIEDVLEEIVGEIQDEYDSAEEPLVEQISETEAVFNARVPIDQVNETMSLDLPNEGDTLAGLVYSRLEKMPKVGDRVVVGDVVISVLSVIGRRIKKARVTKMATSQDSEVGSK
jgi:putative hemolysin